VKPFLIGGNSPLIQKNTRNFRRLHKWGFCNFPCILSSSQSNSFTKEKVKLGLKNSFFKYSDKYGMAAF